ncbi:MAG: hypothetical protein H5U10_12620 [Desulfacinum sp.]|nr:hypothetical protein [Desulfacinum sp.]
MGGGREHPIQEAARRLRAVLDEPVLSKAVLIVESDDWGPGPDSHARVLEDLGALLKAHRDHRGCHPVVTLGLVLRTPVLDGKGSNLFPSLHWIGFHHEQSRLLLESLRKGVKEGVFSLQLHGQAHGWEPQMETFLKRCGQAAGRFFHGGFLCSELLPPDLQSRWLDTGKGEDSTTCRKNFAEAAYREALSFSRELDRPPTVAVPPTFIWNDAVEEGWARGGVRVVVTPGKRYASRDAARRPVPDPRRRIHNGLRNRLGQTYVVRNTYFEPSLGHKAEKVLEALQRDHLAGRPTLVESHRWNFIRDDETRGRTFRELDRLYRAALNKYGHLVFMTTEELAQALTSPHSPLRERSLPARLRAILRRIWQDRILRAWACLTGLVVPGFLLVKVLEGILDRYEKRAA